MKNLIFYGTTDYGPILNSSDNLKFKELSNNFKTYVITYGKKNDLIDHKYVNIMYIKTKSLFLQYLKFYFLKYQCCKKILYRKKIDIISSKDPISALIPTIIKIFLSKI